MRIQTRNLGCAGLALAALLASDVTVMTAGSLPGSEAKYLSAQETEERNQQDEERMFLEARRALNQEDYDRAAELFQALRTKYHTGLGGRFVADSYYWEAFGRYREGDLGEALALLDLASVQKEGRQHVHLGAGAYGNGRLYRDIRDLRHRIQRQLAEQGDPGAAEEVLRRSEAVLADTAAFAPDSAAFREMQRDTEALMREIRESTQEELQRMRRASDDAIEQYREWYDSTDVREALRQRELMVQLAEAEAAQLARQQMAETLVDSAATANPWGLRMYRGPEGEQMFVNERGFEFSLAELSRHLGVGYNQLLSGIDIHPECEDALIQQEALTSLLRLETDRMPTVRSMLDRKDECSAHLRYMAVNWLAQEGTDEAWDVLTDVARDHADTQTRRWAVTNLARFETPETAEILIDVLRESDDREMQDAAIKGLYRHQSDEATEALVEFAADGSKADELRQEAVSLVAHHIAPGSARTLFERLDSEAVKLSLLEVLAPRGHGEEAIGKWLREVGMSRSHSNNVRRRAMVAWGWLSLVDLDLVNSAYQELADPEFRDQVLYALYLRAEEDKENADAIIDKMIELARAETDPEVRKRAVYWLGRTGSERAAAFLQEILREGSDGTTGLPN